MRSRLEKEKIVYAKVLAHNGLHLSESCSQDILSRLVVMKWLILVTFRSFIQEPWPEAVLIIQNIISKQYKLVELTRAIHP